MRVLMTSWEYPPNVVGGLGKHVAELLPALAQMGVQLHLLTPLRGNALPYEEVQGAHVHRIATPNDSCCDFFGDVVAANALLREAGRGLLQREGPFDLIHNHDWLTSFVASGLKNEFKLPLVSTVHATERGRGRGHLHSEQAVRVNDAEWRLTYESWRVICCTQFMANELVTTLNVPNDKIDVIPNGVDPRPYAALDGLDLRDVRARYAQPYERLVLYVGRIVHEKGVEVLLRSVPQVLAQMPNTRFVIAGRGPELNYLRGLAQGLGLEGHVTMAGFLSDEERNKLYKVADCAVFPSLYEPFGIVALEAMAARVPVVASEVGGLREVVQHGETGITIYPGDPASCAWGILHTLQHPDWAASRVENAYRRLLQDYAWSTIAAQTTEVYLRVVSERARTQW